MPPIARRLGGDAAERVVDRGLRTRPLADPPAPWKDAEEMMRDGIKDQAIVFGDDKSTSRFWVADADELHYSKLSDLFAASQSWLPTSMSVSMVQAFEITRGRAALPRFLTRAPYPSAGDPPSMFPLCTSKCY